MRRGIADAAALLRAIRWPTSSCSIELPHPIPSRRLRRITFVLTNGKRLNEAWEINDLFLGPREQDLLWRAPVAIGPAVSTKHSCQWVAKR